MKIIVATRNRHKVVEIAAIMRDLPVQLVPIDDVAPDAPLIENEPTFEGNALAKARQAAVATGMPALADDSGVEVDALDGAPGVRSARYAGEPCDDQRNNAKLLAALAGVPPEKRTGRYRCAAAYVDPAAGIEIVRTGSCDARVLEEPRGSGGFGYDPLFFVESLQQSMAEIAPDEKNRISHRGAAFRALTEALRPVLAGR